MAPEQSPNAPASLHAEIERLRQRERHLMHMLNSAQDAVVAMGADGRVIDWNPGAERLLGWPAVDAIGRSLSQLIVPSEHRDAHERGLRRYLETRQSNMFSRLISVEAMRRDGSRMPCELSIWPIEGEETLAFGAFLRDISERKRLEEQLTHTLQERETILESSVVGIAFLGPDGRFRWANPAMLQLFGAGPGQEFRSMEVVYQSREQYLQVGAAVAQAIARGEAFQSELEMRRLDGQPIWISLSGKAVSPRDLAQGTVWTAVDITDRKHAEREMALTLEQQRELNALRSRFVAMTSHEFRTPLASILSSAELLRYYGDRMDAAERLEMIVSIEKGVQRMTRMIDRVLQIGKGEAQMLEFSPQPVPDMGAFCQSLLDEARATFPTASHVWRFEVDPALNGREFDEKLLRHALGNLLSNAIKYSPHGGPLRFVAQLGPEGRPVFEIADSGIGIPPEEIPHLFESFHRASNVGDIGGTGLGLAIVKKSVELHGGQIQVHSALGQGTTFTVRL